jgi:phage/plasmid-like protein (TIGR03299 family)
MSHNINYNSQTGQYSFFSVKQKAWHGLGTVVTDYPTSAEAIQCAGLNYEVQKTSLFTQCSNLIIEQTGNQLEAEKLEVPTYYATVRADTNTVLGVVGKDYEIVQNKDAFSFFDSIVGAKHGVLYETAGALGKGERIFITAKLPDYIRVGNGDDIIEKYLFLSTSHDGSGSITAAFTPIRIVCQNTLNAALRNMSNVVKIRHTANAKQRLEEAHRVMGIANKHSVEIEQVFNRWTKVSITDKEVMKLIELAMAPSKETLRHLETGNRDELSTMFKNSCDDVFSYAMISDSQNLATTKGTLFGCYNAVTGYFQNVRNYNDNDAKLKSIMFGGTAQQRSQKAFDLCQLYDQNGAGCLKFN